MGAPRSSVDGRFAKGLTELIDPSEDGVDRDRVGALPGFYRASRAYPLGSRFGRERLVSELLEVAGEAAHVRPSLASS